MRKVTVTAEIMIMVPVKARVNILLHANEGTIIPQIVKKIFGHKKFTGADLIDMQIQRLIQPDEFLDIAVRDMLDDPKVKVQVDSIDTVDSR